MKAGDTATVVKNITDHWFTIGQVVTVMRVHKNNIKASDGKDYWYVKREELEPAPKRAAGRPPRRKE